MKNFVASNFGWHNLAENEWLPTHKNITITIQRRGVMQMNDIEQQPIVFVTW